MSLTPEGPKNQTQTSSVPSLAEISSQRSPGLRAVLSTGYTPREALSREIALLSRGYSPCRGVDLTIPEFEAALSRFPLDSKSLFVLRSAEYMRVDGNRIDINREIFVEDRELVLVLGPDGLTIDAQLSDHGDHSSYDESGYAPEARAIGSRLVFPPYGALFSAPNHEGNDSSYLIAEGIIPKSSQITLKLLRPDLPVPIGSLSIGLTRPIVIAEFPSLKSTTELDLAIWAMISRETGIEFRSDQIPHRRDPMSPRVDGSTMHYANIADDRILITTQLFHQHDHVQLFIDCHVPEPIPTGYLRHYAADLRLSSFNRAVLSPLKYSTTEVTRNFSVGVFIDDAFDLIRFLNRIKKGLALGNKSGPNA